jgi:hypothetical protein
VGPTADPEEGKATWTRVAQRHGMGRKPKTKGHLISCVDFIPRGTGSMGPMRVAVRPGPVATTNDSRLSGRAPTHHHSHLSALHTSAVHFMKEQLKHPCV